MQKNFDTNLFRMQKKIFLSSKISFEYLDICAKKIIKKNVESRFPTKTLFLLHIEEFLHNNLSK